MEVVKCASPFASTMVDVSREVKSGLREVRRGAGELKRDTQGELLSSSGEMHWKSIIY
jgi:hypothetical protein